MRPSLSSPLLFNNTTHHYYGNNRVDVTIFNWAHRHNDGGRHLTETGHTDSCARWPSFGYLSVPS